MITTEYYRSMIIEIMEYIKNTPFNIKDVNKFTYNDIKLNEMYKTISKSGSFNSMVDLGVIILSRIIYQHTYSMEYMYDTIYISNISAGVMDAIRNDKIEEAYINYLYLLSIWNNDSYNKVIDVIKLKLSK